MLCPVLTFLQGNPAGQFYGHSLCGKHINNNFHGHPTKRISILWPASFRVPLLCSPWFCNPISRQESATWTPANDKALMHQVNIDIIAFIMYYSAFSSYSVFFFSRYYITSVSVNVVFPWPLRCPHEVHFIDSDTIQKTFIMHSLDPNRTEQINKINFTQ